MQIIRCITGSTNKHLLPDDFANILIPQVPIEIQNKITSEFEIAMIKAKQLKLEARNGLEQQKKQVEKMILSSI